MGATAGHQKICQNLIKQMHRSASQVLLQLQLFSEKKKTRKRRIFLYFWRFKRHLSRPFGMLEAGSVD